MDKYDLKENARHGTVSFPMALYEWNNDSQWRVIPHWHEETEIVCFKKGTFKVWLNTKEHTIKAPAMMCIHAGEIHSMLFEPGVVESAIVFNLNILSFEHYDAIQAKMIGPLLDGRLKMPLFIESSNGAFEETKTLYEKTEQKMKEMETCKEERKKNVLYLQIKALLFEMFACFYQYGLLSDTNALPKSDDYQIANLKKVISYINENYAKKICLKELAGLVNMNEQYFCRYFKKNVQKTITEYINDVRIEKAAMRLAESDEKIIMIAQDVGFENIGYFIRRFKKEKGVTPSEYRRTVKKSK